MRNFLFSELWGPFSCEHNGGCDQETYTIQLTDQEDDKLPKKSGPGAANFILKNKLGIALCSKHR